MKIRLTNVIFFPIAIGIRKGLLKNLMRTFIFLLCTTVFSFSPSDLSSQNDKVKIEVEKNFTVDEVFKIIKQQTDYRFIYQEDMFKSFPTVHLKKGIIKVDDLLEKSLSKGDFNYEFTSDNTIVIKEKSENLMRVQQTLSGKVNDENGMPLGGVTVLVNTNERGTSTDMDGKYSIKVNTGDKISFSYVGFLTQEFTISNQLVLDVILLEDAAQLDEVLLVGYGSTKKERVGSAISQIDAEQIEAISTGATSFEQILGGQIKGVQITQSSGAPGAAAVFRIRGVTSPFGGGNNQPLYVIDGVPFNTDAQFDIGASYNGASQNPLLSISPNDIETLTVLKDAGATAIYGSRGANGVILVTTKRGKKNSGIRVTLDYNLNLSNPIEKFDVLDADGFKELQTMVARNTLDAFEAGSAGFAGYQSAYQIIDPDTNEIRAGVFDLISGRFIPVFGDGNSNWQDEVYRKDAPMHQYNVGMSGGNEKTNFFLGLSHTDQKALFINSTFKRYGARLGVDSEVNDWLKLGTSLNYSGTKDDNPFDPALGTNTLLSLRPDYNTYQEDGTFQNIPYLWIPQAPGLGLLYLETANPVANLDREVTSNATSFVGNAYAEAKLFDGFKVRADVNTAVFNTRGRNFIPIRSDIIWAGAISVLQNSASENLNSSVSFQANYNKQINKHSIDAMVGASWDKSTFYRNSVTYHGFADDYVLTNAPSGATVIGSIDGKAESGINSVFSRLQYSFDGKYTATANFRTDKSSKFGPQNKRAYFPSGALNWNIDKENFMDNFDFVDKLILRTSYGKSGSANISDFVYLQAFEAGAGTDQEYVPGQTTIIPNDIYPNADIRWESTKEFNIGLDFSVLANRLYGSFDVYDKLTDGILVASPFPQETGAGSFTSNLAEVSNKGWEFEIGADIIRSQDINWSVSFNIAANRNKVESMEGNALAPSQSKYFTVGEPVGTIKGYRVLKIIQEQSEIDALNAASSTGLYYQPTTAPGDYLYKDLNGDNRITVDDQEVIGSIQPDYFGGFNTMFSYKRLSLTASFQYTVGNESDWANNQYFYGASQPGYNSTSQALTDTWTPDNRDAKFARVIFGNSGNDNINDAILQDNSYLRMKMLRLNYEIPQEFLEKLFLKNATVYVSGTNLLTFTDFKGIDPEIGGSSISNSARSYDPYPYSKTFTFGVKIGL